MRDYHIYHELMNKNVAVTYCAGSSMEPVYGDGERINIHPFTEERPHPMVGDVVHFYSRGGFNRHQVSDIFIDREDTIWYRLVMGNGWHDQFVERDMIIGYVIPRRMALKNTEPRFEFTTRAK